MADNNNSFININDDPQKINQYEKAFTKLKTSIDGLSIPLNNFSKNINELNKDLSKYTDAINKVTEQNKEFASTGDKATNKLSDFASAFTTSASIIEFFTTKIKLLQAALTGGLAIIIAFGPEILKYANALLKGKEAIDQAKMSLDALNKGVSSSNYANAVENLDTLRIKVDLAKKGFVSKSEVVKEYNKTLGQAIGQVKTLDEVETMLKNNGKDYIQMMLYKASAMAAIKEASDNQVLAEKEKHRSDEESSSWLDSGLANADKNSELGKLYRKHAEENRNEAAKPFQDKAHAAQKIAEHFFELAAKIEQHSPINKIKKQIDDLERSSEAKIKGSKVFKRIQDLKDQLKTLDPNYEDNQPTTPSNEPRKPKPQKVSRATEDLEAKSITFAQQIELDKQHYDTEQSLLQDQLDKKLISQEEFNKQSEALQQQYHLAIGDKIKTFSKTDLDTVKQHMQGMVDAHKLKGDIEKDEHDVKKAILPGDKLKAEQQLITDKYNYEIVLAAGNAEKIKQLEEQKQQDLTTLNKQYEQERKEFALQTAQKVSDAAFGILKGSIQSQADAKIKGLETQKQAELANTNLTAGQRRAIEDKYKKKEAEEKVKAFKAEQRASILQAVINGALAITKVTSQTGVLSPFVIPGIIAETAIQVATIAKQKAPQYAKGGLHYQSDGRGALLSGYSRMDDTNAYLRSGEAVVVSEAMRNPWARNLVSAINVAYGGRDFSVTNPGRGYAIGGIYTDGGNANRYYNQPVNDVKDLANTVAYQMINNFPPIYVDVKDVNNQQNILAQTVNRVNL